VPQMEILNSLRFVLSNSEITSVPGMLASWSQPIGHEGLSLQTTQSLPGNPALLHEYSKAQSFQRLSVFGHFS
jgi:hypothetical protein